MGLFDNNDGSTTKTELPNTGHVSNELPKLAVEHGEVGVPNLKVSQPLYRYTKVETGQHPLADRSDAILPPKFKGDHTFDPTTRVFEPTSTKSEEPKGKAPMVENAYNINQNFRPLDSATQSASPPQASERSLFGGSSSGGESSLRSPEQSTQRAFSGLFEPGRARGNNDGSLFVLIIASIAVLVGAILKLLVRVFWPWANRLSLKARKIRLLRR